VTDPGDEEVLTALAGAPDADRARLRAAVAAVEEADGPLAEGRGGERGADGAVPVFDHRHWDGRSRLRSATARASRRRRR
jgi:hypothetical protein